MPAFEIVAVGAGTTLQDGGRPGWSSVAVGRSGPADPVAATRANRIVGNREDDALVEVTFGGLVVRALVDLTLALAGAPCPTTTTGPTLSHPGLDVPFDLRAGGTLALGLPRHGVRTYLAVRGGIVGGTTALGTPIEPVLGSLSTDVLGGIGPAPLAVGDRLDIGPPHGPVIVDVAPVRADHEAVRVVRIEPGPRADWCVDAMASLTASTWTVQPDSNRVALRLDGPPLVRATRPDGRTELPPEGMVLGAVQIPPNGLPVVFGVDHPTTGGYPVVAVVVPADNPALAQLRPGELLRFSASG